MTMILRGTTLKEKSEAFSNIFEQWLNDYLASQAHRNHFVEKLWKSKSYSVKSGGKRFRPFLAALFFELFEKDLKKIKNFCLALEMVHTYSLIHDDLPCMDNDDLRRGQPTNHKAFDEATALLAGDSLLTEAIHILASDDKISAATNIQLIKMLTAKIGAFGMVGGQVLDMNTLAKPSLVQLELMHTMKTAFLIQAAVMGSAFLADAEIEQIAAAEELGLQLGLAFQIKDDLLDANDKDQDFKSYVTVLGYDNAMIELKNKSVAAQKAIRTLNLKTEYLIELIEYNMERTS